MVNFNGISSIILNVTVITWHRAQGQQDSSALLIEQVRQQWTQPEWQNEYLSSSSGFVRLCSNPTLMRFIVNTVVVFENALKGYRFKKRKLNRISEMNHPLACHLSWILPPLLKVCESVLLPLKLGIPDEDFHFAKELHDGFL